MKKMMKLSPNEFETNSMDWELGNGGFFFGATYPLCFYGHYASNLAVSFVYFIRH